MWESNALDLFDDPRIGHLADDHQNPPNETRLELLNRWNHLIRWHFRASQIEQQTAEILPLQLLNHLAGAAG
jgi:hypothetical protein